jgi:hypothetical protein
MHRVSVCSCIVLVCAFGLHAGDVSDAQRRIFEAQTLQPCDPDSLPPRNAFVPDACENGDFEAGLDTWSGAYGNVAFGTDEPDLRCLHPGLLPGTEGGPLPLSNSRHTVVLAADGPDPIAGIELVASGARAVRIGNTAIGGGVELLERTFVVSADRPSIGFWYAVVLQDPHHKREHQPLFRVRVTDSHGEEIHDVVNLGFEERIDTLVADRTDTEHFLPLPKDIVYVPWTCAFIDLTRHVGQTVTVQFIVEDCSKLGHWGYAYVDDFCHADCALLPVDSCGFGANLVGNGDFEAGNAGFGSDFAYEPAPASPRAVLPGEYAVIDGTEAATNSPTWLVGNHGLCDSTGMFLAVNGDTGKSSGRRLVWSQTIPVEPETAYCFSAYLRNLSKCALDVRPVIELHFSSPPEDSALSVPDTEGTDACDWDQVRRRIVIPAGVVSLTVEIRLDESGEGDGNDLAVDDISLRKEAPEVP